MTSTATDGPAHTPIWTSETSLELPNTDIVSFAFGKLGTYDLDKPVCGILLFDSFSADQL